MGNKALVIEWRYDSKYDTYFGIIGNKMLGRITPSKGKYTAVYLEWDESKWPNNLFDPIEGVEPIAKADLMHGDAHEVEIGLFKTVYQAREAIEQHVGRQK